MTTMKDATPELVEEVPAADPSPGEAGYNWADHYDGAALYMHTFKDGTVVGIKTFAAIYSKTWLYSIHKLQTNVDFEFAAIDRAACPTAQEVLMALDNSGDGDPIAELFAAWTAAGTDGLPPGK